jgi:molybdate transport system substrate-binding protein
MTATVNVLCSIGTRTVLEAVTPAFEQANNAKLAARYNSSNALMRHIEAGEPVDVVLFTATALDDLIVHGKVARRIDLCRSPVGLAVAKGAPKPDIGSVEAFRHTLLAARSIAHSKSGASGLYFIELIKQLGIADVVAAKARVLDGIVADVVARGEAEVAIQQISELMQSDGIDIAGPLPDALQSITIFSAGVFVDAREPQTAQALVTYLTSPAAAPIYQAKGLEPI